MRSCKNISHIQVLVIYFFSYLTHKTKTGSANRWETPTSNPSIPIRLSSQAINKYDLTLLLRLFEGRQSCAFFQSDSRLQVDSLDMTAAPHPRFSVEGHILRTGEDALKR
jgi:hypothetical protein